mmetsp:Transcript_53160/g.113556  ORF Transcript_53160/g.113556 Transcript_53160/m.113556 type:complete len:215 (-) Transcript_53160:766-1410(-)
MSGSAALLLLWRRSRRWSRPPIFVVLSFLLLVRLLLLLLILSLLLLLTAVILTVGGPAAGTLVRRFGVVAACVLLLLAISFATIIPVEPLLLFHLLVGGTIGEEPRAQEIFQFWIIRSTFVGACWVHVFLGLLQWVVCFPLLSGPFALVVVLLLFLLLLTLVFGGFRLCCTFAPLAVFALAVAPVTLAASLAVFAVHVRLCPFLGAFPLVILVR